MKLIKAPEPGWGEVENPPLPLNVFISGISNDDYHGSPGISKSGLDWIARSGLHYRWHKQNPTPGTRALVVGSAFHSLLLEPDVFPSEFVRSEYEEFRTKEAREWRKAQEESGRSVLGIKGAKHNPSEWDSVHYMVEMVRNNPFADILTNPEDLICEASGYWIDPGTGRLCRIRPDAINTSHQVLIDIKTMEDASLHGFTKSSSTYRYHVQDAFYSDGARACSFSPQEMIFIAVEKSPPYAVALYTHGPEEEMAGWEAYQRDLAAYDQMKAREEWPGYLTEIRELTFSPWQLRGNAA